MIILVSQWTWRCVLSCICVTRQAYCEVKEKMQEGLVMELISHLKLNFSKPQSIRTSFHKVLTKISKVFMQESFYFDIKNKGFAFVCASLLNAYTSF